MLERFKLLFQVFSGRFSRDQLFNGADSSTKVLCHVACNDQNKRKWKRAACKTKYKVCGHATLPIFHEIHFEPNLSWFDPVRKRSSRWGIWSASLPRVFLDKYFVSILGQHRKYSNHRSIHKHDFKGISS